MLQNEGISKLSEMGINPMPSGTLEELRQEGIDPAQVASCHAPGPGVRGCPFWSECRFGLKQMGGFKGNGPRYVGYFLQTHEGDRKEDFMVCHAYIRTIQARSDAGQIQRMQGKKNAEIIRIVAQEGEKITVRSWVPEDPNNRINGRYKETIQPIDVPKFPRPGDNPRATYDQLLMAQEIRRQKAESEFGEDAFVAAMAAHRAEIAEHQAQPAVDLEMGAAPAVAEPVAAPVEKGKQR